MLMTLVLVLLWSESVMWVKQTPLSCSRRSPLFTSHGLLRALLKEILNQMAYMCFVWVFFLQYIFSCLYGGLTPHLTMVHHSTLSKYQEEQGGLSNQVSKSRSQSKPPPLPLKKVKEGYCTEKKKQQLSLTKGTAFFTFFLILLSETLTFLELTSFWIIRILYCI